MVAKKFGKEHRTVIRSIRDLMGSAQNCAQLFIESSYPDSQGKEQPMYIMNRDGFTLLAMGFKGKRALEFKLQYIEALSRFKAVLEIH